MLVDMPPAIDVISDVTHGEDHVSISRQLKPLLLRQNPVGIRYHNAIWVNGVDLLAGPVFNILGDFVVQLRHTIPSLVV